MITKAAFIVGAVRTSNLNDEQKAALRKHYGLASDSNLMLRNMGRDIVGDAAGSFAGGTIGGVLGGPVGASIGLLAGKGLGMKYMTDKYSVGNAKRIMQSKTEDNQ